MFFWSRIRYSRIEPLVHQCQRHYSQTRAICSNHITRLTRVLENPNNSFNHLKRTDLYGFVRFFAAPVQKSKPDTKDSKVTRLNEQITTQFLRLVSEDGHTVVSLSEALQRAKKLGLDLVEVDRMAKPPVCKLMDFHREKYKKQLKEKEKMKSKPEGTLRKGDIKEVRFSGKCEQKDLQMKADTIQRMMEKGYRVKCMALSYLNNEDEDPGVYLSRLSALIEDVAFVESGPMVVEKKQGLKVLKTQAFVVVRHVKFGPPKKGGKKSTKVAEAAKAATENLEPNITPSDSIDGEEDTESGSEEDFADEDETHLNTSMEMPGGEPTENRTAWSVTEASDDFEKIFGFDDNNEKSASHPVRPMNQKPDTVGRVEGFKTPIHNTGPVVGSTVAKPTFAQGRSHEGSTAYNERNGSRTGFQPTQPIERTSNDTNRFSYSVPRNDSNRPPTGTYFSNVGSTEAKPSFTQRISHESEAIHHGRNELKNVFQPTRSNERMTDDTNKFSQSPPRNDSNRGPTSTNFSHVGYPPQNQGRRPKKHEDAPPPREEKTLQAEASSFRNIKPSTIIEALKQDPSRQQAPNPTRPSFGIFSTPKMDTGADKGRNTFDSSRGPNTSNASLNGNVPTPKSDSQKSEPEDTKEKFGIFSR